MSLQRQNGVWCTKDDVMHDLALATGGGLDVDEHCLVYGERPPPRPDCDIDDEMKILFKGHAWSNTDSRGDANFTKPDLKGIMSMIRMVETDEDEDFSNPIATKPTDVIVISKLNPNVNEFVPKSRASQTSSDKPETDKKTKGTLADKNIPKKTSPSPLAEKYTRKETPSLWADKYTSKETSPGPLTEKYTRKDIPSHLAEKYTRKETPSLLADKYSRKETSPGPLAEKYTRNETPSLLTDKYTRMETSPSPLAEKYTRKVTSPLAEKYTRKETSPLAHEYTRKATPSPLTGKNAQKETLEMPSSSSTQTLSSTTEAEINWLKDKILSKPAKDPYKHSREKNAAIATLLRHCTTPPITTDVKGKPIKLYTPEFFERCKATDFKGTDDSSTEIDKNTEQSIKYPVNKETNLKELTDEENNHIEHTNLTPDVAKDLNLDDTEPTTNLTPNVAKDLKIDDREPNSSYELVEQQKSIAKVTEWLNGPKSPKKNVLKPVMHAGPIAYKRKEVMSPSSTTSTMIDKKISKQDDKAYVPSSYAAELRMKYEKNKIEANKSLNIWDKLENQLKKKDEEIRKKLEQQD